MKSLLSANAVNKVIPSLPVLLLLLSMINPSTVTVTVKLRSFLKRAEGVCCCHVRNNSGSVAIIGIDCDQSYVMLYLQTSYIYAKLVHL